MFVYRNVIKLSTIKENKDFHDDMKKLGQCLNQKRRKMLTE